MSSHSVRTSLNGAPFDGRCDYCYTMSPLLISIVVSFKCVRMNCIPIWVVECVRVQTNDRVLKVAICNDCCCFLQFFFFNVYVRRGVISSQTAEMNSNFDSFLLCFSSVSLHSLVWNETFMCKSFISKQSIHFIWWAHFSRMKNLTLYWNSRLNRYTIDVWCWWIITRRIKLAKDFCIYWICEIKLNAR